MLCPIAVRAEIDRCMEDEDVQPRTMGDTVESGLHRDREAEPGDF
jgi:hypothetical protein